MFPGIGFRMAGHEVSGSVGKPHAAPHVHDVSEIWVAPSEKKGDLVIEAEMDDDKFLVEAPFSIFIPPGMRHCFRVKSESPHFIMCIVLLQGLTSLAFSAPRKGAFLNSPLT
jgi:mannose-6-phosphate isomerase-like protein (cupin superfamily)